MWNPSELRLQCMPSSVDVRSRGRVHCYAKCLSLVFFFPPIFICYLFSFYLVGVETGKDTSFAGFWNTCDSRDCAILRPGARNSVCVPYLCSILQVPPQPSSAGSQGKAAVEISAKIPTWALPCGMCVFPVGSLPAVSSVTLLPHSCFWDMWLLSRVVKKGCSVGSSVVWFLNELQLLNNWVILRKTNRFSRDHL